MKPLAIPLLLAGLLYHGIAPAQTSAPMGQAERFAAKVAEYEAEDRAHAPPKGAILFAGDSQFYRWKTIHEDLPGYTLINRGIDSFQLEHLIQYADRLVLAYEPRLIVLHVGGNDVHNGKTPERVLADFKTLVTKIRAKYPQVRIVFSSITPGPGRWDEAPQRVATNKILRDYIATRADLGFIDLWNPMLTKDGKPREDLWVEDRVHPNHAGYLLRVELTKPFLGPPEHTP
jgi:lysophospholipase L1-like esterase